MILIHIHKVRPRKNHLPRLMDFLVAACLLFGLSLSAHAAELPANAAAKIGPGVFATLNESGSVNVMIALQQRSVGGAVGLDMAVEKSRIADMQSDVLAQLGFFDYEARHTYSAVPALAGRIKSEAGLSAIARNPNVIMIDIDVGWPTACLS